MENLEAEALGVCSAEAYEKYGEKVQEINATELSVNEIVSEAEKIIACEKTCPIGEIDFMDWLIA